MYTTITLHHRNRNTSILLAESVTCLTWAGTMDQCTHRRSCRFWSAYGHTSPVCSKNFCWTQPQLGERYWREEMFGPRVSDIYGGYQQLPCDPGQSHFLDSLSWGTCIVQGVQLNLNPSAWQAARSYISSCSIHKDTSYCMFDWLLELTSFNPQTCFRNGGQIVKFCLSKNCPQCVVVFMATVWLTNCQSVSMCTVHCIILFTQSSLVRCL